MAGEPDTIVAAATAKGPAPRGVIRLSGPCAAACAAAVVRAGAADVRGSGRGVLETSVAVTADGDGPAVPARLLVFRAPRSFTGEDVVEIHLPGAPVLLDLVQDRLVRAGARPAHAGEFTRRAFLNGRIDLTRAEAVLALTRARDRAGRRAALAWLDGAIERRIAGLRDAIHGVLVPLELSLDFSDQDVEIPVPPEAMRRLGTAEAEAAALASGARIRPLAASRPRVVLEGPPNAGKSTLFNRLVGREAALVDGAAGTTRDVLLGETETAGLRVVVADTAGWGVGTTEADREAHRHRARTLREADLVLEVRDARRVRPDRAPPGARRLRALTHADLVDPGPACLPGEVPVCGLTGAGVDELRARLATAVAGPDRGAAEGGPPEVNLRHAAALRAAAASIAAARRALDAGAGAEFVAADLRAALAELDPITGADATQDVLDRIFSEFCIGK